MLRGYLSQGLPFFARMKEIRMKKKKKEEERRRKKKKKEKKKKKDVEEEKGICLTNTYKIRTYGVYVRRREKYV